MRKILIAFLFLFLTGCVYSTSLIPAESRSDVFMVEVEADTHGLAEKAAQQRAREKCSNYSLLYVEGQWNDFNGLWELKWKIWCP